MKVHHFVFWAVLLILIPGCGSSCRPGVETGASTMLEMEQTESNHQKLVKAVPPPQFTTSLEREVLVKRLKAMNVQNKIMYVYCLGLNGNVVYSGIVQGKVASLNSLLTTPEQIIKVPKWKGSNSEFTYHKVASPDFDGSYGSNPAGIFWFEPSGAYREWSGTYFLSDRPVKINTPVSLTSGVELEKKNK